MSSMLGFTFGFGAQDRGLKSAFGSVQSSLTNVSSQVSKLGGIAKNVNLGAMFAGFGTAGLSRISNQLDKIVGGNENLVNGLESTMIASKKAARVIGAQAGMMGKDLDKFTSSSASLAYGMNLGIDQVAKAQKTYTRMSDDFRKGLSKSGIGLKAFLRAEEATGITSEDLMKNLNSLSGSFGFTGEQAGSFLDKFTATVMAGGQGSVAFGTMKETLDNLKTSLQQNTKFLGLDTAAQQKYVEDQILGAQRLAGTLTKTMKIDPADAQAAASAFMNKMNEEQVGISKMMAGIQEGAYGDLFTKIASETGMNVAEVFVGKSPDEALKMLLKIRERLSGMGERGQMAITRLNDAFAQIAPQMQVGLFDDEKSKALVTNLDNISASTDKAKGSFDKFGKAAYTSGLSASDAVSRAKDQFESSMLALGGGSQGYANEQVKAYGELSKRVKDLGGDATWGPLMKRFALASRVGVGAFFLPMKQEGKALEVQYAAISNGLGKNGITGKFEAIRQLGVAGLFLDTTKATTNMAGAVEDAQGKSQKLYEQFLLLKKGFDQFLPVILGVAGAIGAVFGILKLATGVLSPILSLSSAMWRLTFATMGFAASIIGWPATLFLAVVAFIAVWQALPQQVKDEIDRMLGMAAAFINKLTVSLMAFDGEGFANKILDVLDGVAMSIKAFFSGEELAASVDDSGAKKFGIALGNLMTTAWETVKEVVGKLLKGMWEDPEIRKYITIPLGVALVAGALPKIAAMINSVADTAVGKKGVGFAKNKLDQAGGAVKDHFTKGRSTAALADVAMLKAAQSEAMVFAAQMQAAGGAQATLAATQMAQINAAVAGAEATAASTSIYATAMTSVTNFLSTLAGGSAAAGGAVVALIVGSVVAGVTAVASSPETKKALSKSTEVMIKGATVSLDAAAKGLEAAGPSIGKALTNAMSSGYDKIETGSLWQKVMDGMSFLFEDIGTQVTDAFVNLDLSAAAIGFVQGVFSEDNFATATQAVDWGDAVMGFLEAIGSAIVTVLGGAGFVLEMIGALLIKLADAIGAIIIVVLGLIGGLLGMLGQKILMSILTLITQGTELVARGMDKVLDLLPDSWTGGVGGWWSDLAEGASNLTDKIIDKQGQRARDAAAKAAEVAAADTEARNILIANKKANAEAFAKYNDENKVEMLSKMGVDVAQLNEKQLSILNAKLAAATEEYGKSGLDFSERAAQRLLAGVAKGFEKEMNTASGIMLGMGVDSTLTPAEIEARSKGFVAEFEVGIKSALEAQNISFDVMTDAQRKTLKDQGKQFTELTDEQRAFFKSQMDNKARQMAVDGREFSDDVKATLAKSILDGFTAQVAFDKIKKIRFEQETDTYGQNPFLDPSLTGEERDTALAENAQAFAWQQTYEQSKLDEAAGGVDAVSALSGGAFVAGKKALEATAGGLLAGVPLVGDAVDTALGKITEYIPSPTTKAKKGPLVNVADGGVQIMAEIARGMQEGAAIMVAAMTDAMTKVKDEMYLGITDIYNTMANNFDFIGRRASQAFTSGVILEQQLDIGALKQQLTDLLLGEFASEIKVVDVSGEAGSATLSVDSAKTLSNQISGLREALVAELQAIKTATQSTAENTKPLRGNVGIAFVAQGAK